VQPLAAAPEGPVEVPPVVGRLAAGAEIVPVWRNELGGLTFRLGEHRYVKWIASAPDAAGTDEIDLLAEADRLVWAGRYATVPEVVETGRDETGQWLVTRAIAGESAVSPRWLAEPQRAAEAIGRGLRRLHDALPVAGCPYTWSVEERLARFEERVAAGASPEDWMPEYRGLAVDAVREELHRVPPVDLVVCHGDACAPNTLLDEHGEVAGHVDLGRLGVADRWADLAVAAWSTVWNYGPGFEAAVYRGYGIRPDEERIRYYRLLWDVS
jgi:kanamycin kinase